MSRVQACAPTDLGALKAVLARTAGPLCYIAGGTDLLVAPREPPREGWIIDISRTRGLAHIGGYRETLQIGATATLAELTRNTAIRNYFPVLAQAAGLCGSVQIRNRATIGGNVANASPAGDLLPVLKCADAAFQVMVRDGSERWLAFNALVIGAGRTSLGPGDLITRIDIPMAGRLSRFAFVKLGRRDDMTISRLNLTMEAAFDDAARRFGEVRLVVGAIAPTPLGLESVASHLAGKTLTQEIVADFLNALLAAVDAAIPGRVSQAYKRRAIMGLGLDLVEQVTGIDDLATGLQGVLR